jgi:putative hydrolase of the HAD superfamily
MTTRAVIFDLFGTVVHPFHQERFDESLERMAEAVGLSPQTMRQAWVRETALMRHTGGFPSLREEIAHICRLHDAASDADIDAALRIRYEFTRRTLDPRPDAVSTLQALRAKGLRTGLISDCSAEVPELWSETRLPPLFDVALFSCEVKMKKPDPGIYRLACSRLGVEPAECIYIGDGCSGELAGAKACGMRPFLLRPPGEPTPTGREWEGHAWTGETLSALGELVAIVE